MEALHQHLQPVDVAGLVVQLETLSNLNSFSTNYDGLERTLEACETMFSPLAETHDRLELDPQQTVADDGSIVATPLGAVARFRSRPDASRQLLFVGHYDTVFAPGHPFQTARRDGDRLVGPGVADMKGGLLMLAEVLKTLEQSPWASDTGWEVLLTPDEEIGSPGSSKVLAQAADDKTAGFIFEPSFPDGSLASGRKGSGTYDFHISGRAAHAGRDHHLGRNAIIAAAHLATELSSLTGAWPDTTVNVSAISGGAPTNIVPDSAVVRLNVRVPTRAVAAAFDERVRLIADDAAGEGITVTTHGTFTRSPKEMTPGIESLLQSAKSAALSLGFDLGWASTGGVSDGNNLAEAGLANLDNLGVHGGNIHSDAEFMYPDSLTQRTHLASLIVLAVAAGQTEVAE